MFMQDIQNMQNTHFYDGKLKENVKIILQLNSSNKTIKECNDEILQLAIKLNYKISEVKKVCELFISDEKNNYDSTNDVDLKDILPRLLLLVEKWDVQEQKLFLEQISDVLGGSCSVGRTVRTCQLFFL